MKQGDKILFHKNYMHVDCKRVKSSHFKVTSNNAMLDWIDYRLFSSSWQEYPPKCYAFSLSAWWDLRMFATSYPIYRHFRWKPTVIVADISTSFVPPGHEWLKSSPPFYILFFCSQKVIDSIKIASNIKGTRVFTIFSSSYDIKCFTLKSCSLFLGFMTLH